MSKEFRIGLIALVAGVLLYYGFNYLSGTNVFAKTNRYYVKYDHISGLAPGSAVNIKGVQVGRVNAIRFDQPNHEIIVTLDLEGDIILGDSTVAELSSAGFLGGEIIILQEKTNGGTFTPGDTLIAKVDKGLSEILESAQPITDNLQITIRRINEILLGMEGFGESLTSAVSNMDTVLVDVRGILEHNDNKIDYAFNKLDTIFLELSEAIKPLNETLKNMEAISDSLKNSEMKATIANSNKMLEKVNMTLDSLTNSKGTIGKLMSEDSLYQNLNKTLVDLDKLLIHFNEYPKDFMGPLGRKNKKLKGVKKD